MLKMTVTQKKNREGNNSDDKKKWKERKGINRKQVSGLKQRDCFLTSNQQSKPKRFESGEKNMTFTPER